MKALHYILSAVAIGGCFLQALSQESEEPKLNLAPMGRVLIDGATYFSPEKELFKDGLAISEARIGAKFEYGKWSSWIDVGFAYGKIGLRNMWIQYDFDSKSSLRIGNSLQPFGLQSVTTASLKTTFEAPLASALFTPTLRLGVMYTYKNPSIYSSTSFNVEPSSLTNVMNYPDFNKQGCTLLSRFAWRKKDSGKDGKSIVQAGISLGVSTPERKLDQDGYDIHDAFVTSTTYPTKVTTLTALSSTVGDARSLVKFTPELLLSKGKVALEAQYFFQCINRKNSLPNYISQSGYLTLRGMILGGDYTYDMAGAQLVYPKKNALECVVDYNYATLSDKKAGIFGGRANSFNVTLNYYFNKYITARLNYSYTHVWDRIDIGRVTQNVVQARIMVLF
ncbi:MAG: hypothetical protein J1E82_09485 [Muribaculaceae bacterium]|nr:hypothetical protein [Muribaculaceae bacterium]